MRLEDWMPQYDHPEYVEEKALELAALVGPDAVLAKLSALSTRDLPGSVFWRIRSLLKPGPFEIPPQ
jgi:hypothetical protein